MNKIVKQELELNLVLGARKILSKLGPRKLAAVLALSSMISINGCGKKVEVQSVSLENSVNDDNYDNAKYRNRALGGKIVDNHNRELYISKTSDLERVVEGTSTEDNEKSSNKNSQDSGNKKTTTSNSSNQSTNYQTEPSQSSTPNIPVEDNVTDPVPAPDLLPGETVNYFDDGSYIVIPSQDNINPPVNDTTPITTPDDQPSTNPEQPSDEIDEPPVVEEKYEGYVVLKKNYSDDTYFYSFVLQDGEYIVHLDDVEFASNLSTVNSNVYALAIDEDALSYAYAEGWAKVGLYNPTEYGILDSVYNIEAVCDERVADALKAIKEAENEASQGLYLTP